MASVVSRFIKNHKLLSLIACAGILMGGNAMLRHYTGYEYESPFAKAARQAQERVEVRSDQSGLNIAQAQQNRIENSAASAFEQVLEQGRLAASGYGTNTSGIEVPVSNEVPSTINDKITAAGIGTPGQSSTENTPAPQNPQSFEEVMALARQNRANGTTGIQVQTQVAEQSSSTVEQTPTVQQESNVETPSSAPSEVAPQNPEQQRLTKSEQKEALKAIGRYMAQERETLEQLNAMMGMDDETNIPKGFGMYLDENGEYQTYGFDEKTGLEKVTDTIIQETKGAWNGTIDVVSSILPSQQQVGDALDAITPTQEGLQKIWDGTVQIASDTVDYVTPSKETMQVIGDNLTFEKGTTTNDVWQSVKGGFNSVVDALTPAQKENAQVAQETTKTTSVQEEVAKPEVAQAETTTQEATEPNSLEKGWNTFVNNLTFKDGTTMDGVWQSVKGGVNSVVDALTPAQKENTQVAQTEKPSAEAADPTLLEEALDAVTPTQEGWNRFVDNLTFEKGTTMDSVWQSTKAGAQTAYDYMGDALTDAKNWTVRQFEPDPYIVTIVTPTFGALPVVLPAEMNPHPRTFMQRTGDNIAAVYNKAKEAGQTVADAFTTKEGFNKMVDGTAQVVKDLPGDVSNFAQKSVEKVSGLFTSEKEQQTAEVKADETKPVEAYTYVGTGAEDVNITVSAFKPEAEGKQPAVSEKKEQVQQSQKNPQTLAEFLKSKGLSDEDIQKALTLANKEAKRAQLKWSGKGLGLEEGEQSVAVSTRSILKQKLSNGRG